MGSEYRARRMVWVMLDIGPPLSIGTAIGTTVLGVLGCFLLEQVFECGGADTACLQLFDQLDMCRVKASLTSGVDIDRLIIYRDRVARNLIDNILVFV